VVTTLLVVVTLDDRQAGHWDGEGGDSVGRLWPGLS